MSGFAIGIGLLLGNFVPRTLFLTASSRIFVCGLRRKVAGLTASSLSSEGFATLDGDFLLTPSSIAASEASSSRATPFLAGSCLMDD